ncbi:hypothetical protein CKAH01_07843 [Colletotrichum kahawae]|uniref:Uncharacterized protein n=1 Tax=Colletotrichum kahawae TaxID=34407 RepID=A0AAD9Y517_COLKA|nr:hypothetical protein CKAH01_07843 [Colletotrichum kahawae]
MCVIDFADGYSARDNDHSSDTPSQLLFNYPCDGTAAVKCPPTGQVQQETAPTAADLDATGHRPPTVTLTVRRRFAATAQHPGRNARAVSWSTAKSAVCGPLHSTVQGTLRPRSPSHDFPSAATASLHSWHLSPPILVDALPQATNR